MKRQPCFRLPVTPDDVVRHALAAYYRGVADATAPVAYPDPDSWSSPEYFLEQLVDYMQLRMRVECADAGHPIDCDRQRYERWSQMPTYRDLHTRDVDPSLWASLCASNPALLEPTQSASMAHGCAAPSPAVGPAPPALSDLNITVPADPVFYGHAMQELPSSNDQHARTGIGEKS